MNTYLFLALLFSTAFPSNTYAKHNKVLPNLCTGEDTNDDDETAGGGNGPSHTAGYVVEENYSELIPKINAIEGVIAKKMRAHKFRFNVEWIEIINNFWKRLFANEKELVRKVNQDYKDAARTAELNKIFRRMIYYEKLVNDKDWFLYICGGIINFELIYTHPQLVEAVEHNELSSLLIFDTINSPIGKLLTLMCNHEGALRSPLGRSGGEWSEMGYISCCHMQRIIINEVNRKALREALVQFLIDKCKMHNASAGITADYHTGLALDSAPKFDDIKVNETSTSKFALAAPASS